MSASRATDVPKFYADWLLARLRAGFCTWTNPFNRHLCRHCYANASAEQVLANWRRHAADCLGMSS